MQTINPFLTPTAVLSNNAFTSPAITTFLPQHHASSSDQHPDTQFTIFSIGSTAYVTSSRPHASPLHDHSHADYFPHHSGFQPLNPPFVPTSDLKIPVIKSTLGLSTLFHKLPVITSTTSTSHTSYSDNTGNKAQPQTRLQTPYDFIQSQLHYLAPPVLAQFHAINHDLSSINLCDEASSDPTLHSLRPNQPPSSHATVKRSRKLEEKDVEKSAIDFVQRYLSPQQLASPHSTPSKDPSKSHLPNTSPKQSTSPQHQHQSHQSHQQFRLPPNHSLSAFYLDTFSLPNPSPHNYNDLINAHSPPQPQPQSNIFSAFNTGFGHLSHPQPQPQPARSKPIVHSHVATNPFCQCRRPIGITPTQSPHTRSLSTSSPNKHICAISAVLRNDLTEVYLHIHTNSPPPNSPSNSPSPALHASSPQSPLPLPFHAQPTIPLFACWIPTPPGAKSIALQIPDVVSSAQPVLANVLIAGSNGVRLYSLLKTNLKLPESSASRNTCSPFSLFTPTTRTLLNTLTGNFSPTLFQFPLIPVQLGHLFQRFHFNHIAFSLNFPPSISLLNSSNPHARSANLASATTFDDLSLAFDLTPFLSHLQINLSPSPSKRSNPAGNPNNPPKPRLLIDLRPIVLNLIDCMPISPLGFSKAFTTQVIASPPSNRPTAPQQTPAQSPTPDTSPTHPHPPQFDNFPPPVPSTRGMTTKEQSLSTNFPISSQILTFHTESKSLSPHNTTTSPQHYLLLSYANGAISIHASLNAFELGEKYQLVANFMDFSHFQHLFQSHLSQNLNTSESDASFALQIARSWTGFDSVDFSISDSKHNPTSHWLESFVNHIIPHLVSPFVSVIDVIHGSCDGFDSSSTSISSIPSSSPPTYPPPLLYPALLHDLLQSHEANPLGPLKFPPILSTQLTELTSLFSNPFTRQAFPSSSRHAHSEDPSDSESSDEYTGLDNFTNFNFSSESGRCGGNHDDFNAYPSVTSPLSTVTTSRSTINRLQRHIQGMDTCPAEIAPRIIFNPVSYAFDPSRLILPLNYAYSNVRTYTIQQCQPKSPLRPCIPYDIPTINHFVIRLSVAQADNCATTNPSTTDAFPDQAVITANPNIALLSLNATPSIKPPHTFSHWIPSLSLFVSVTYQLCPTPPSQQTKHLPTHQSMLTPAQTSPFSATIDYLPFLTFFSLSPSPHRLSSPTSHSQLQIAFPSKPSKSAHPFTVLAAIPISPISPISITSMSPQVIGLSSFVLSHPIPEQLCKSSSVENIEKQRTVPASSLANFVLWSDGSINCYYLRDVSRKTF